MLGYERVGFLSVAELVLCDHQGGKMIPHIKN